MSDIFLSFITIIACLIALPILITILKFLVCYLSTGISPQNNYIREREESMRIGRQRAEEMNAEEDRLRLGREFLRKTNEESNDCFKENVESISERRIIANRFEIMEIE